MIAAPVGQDLDQEAGQRLGRVVQELFLTVECFQYRMISGMFSTGCSK